MVFRFVGAREGLKRVVFASTLASKSFRHVGDLVRRCFCVECAHN